jgi:hypothetical protein
MSRCPKLEAILEARFRFENGAPDEQARLRAELDSLLQEAVAASADAALTMRQLEDSMRDVYREFVRVRRREERDRLSRIR